MTLYRWDIAPVGVGLAGEGGGTSPPLSRRVTEDVFPCEQSSHTPTARPLPGRRSLQR